MIICDSKGGGQDNGESVKFHLLTQTVSFYVIPLFFFRQAKVELKGGQKFIIRCESTNYSEGIMLLD